MNLKQKLEAFFSAVEKRLPPAAKIFVGAVAFAAMLFTASQSFKPNDFIQSSVKITNLARTSGGSGVIIDSSKTESHVLTNAHVCGVVKNGGMVISHRGEYMVDSYKLSNEHDLCLISVKNNLHTFTKVAKRSPVDYYEEGTIVGHPALFPSATSVGTFSGKMVIEVLTDFKPCTTEDYDNPRTGLICFILGGIPVIKAYESQLVTALIMSGSSGSAIYNSDRELSNLVFAGNGQLSFAWSVPSEYLSTFLYSEAPNLQPQKPNFFRTFGEGERRSVVDYYSRLVEACKDVTLSKKEKMKSLCEFVKSDMVWRK